MDRAVPWTWSSPSAGVVAALVATSVLLFVVGLAPGYLFEHSGSMNATERCPEQVETEQGWDAECVARIVARGPLYLGIGSLGASFAVGFAAILAIAEAEKTSWVRRASGLFLFGVLAMSWVLSMSGAAESWQLVTSAAVGTVGALGAIVLARWSARLAARLLMLTFLGGWAALLLWNGAEGTRLARSGTAVAG